MEFPVLVYRLGGPHSRTAGPAFSYKQATAEDYEGLLADGWFPTYHEMIISEGAPRRRGRPPKSDA